MQSCSPTTRSSRATLQRACRPACADRHRMGEGRPRPRTLRGSCAAGDERVAEARHGAGGVRAREGGPRHRLRPRRRGPYRERSRARHRQQHADRTIPDGEVLVTDSTTPDWEPLMRRAAAIVTNRGGRTCHAAIVACEFGIPVIVGTENATERLVSGELVTVSCAEGDTGKVYGGSLPFEVRRTD